MVDINFAAQLSECLYKFEQKHCEKIKELEIENRIAWFVIKVQLYYFIYNQTVNLIEIDHVNGPTGQSETGRFAKALNVAGVAAKFWMNWFRVVKRSGTNKSLILSL